ncbi:olfactory receptor 11L1-like [Pseudophryne corroboree]|uniref:olfactory receptor 11L1-like n=1 Tax=Pseudophryne corroboree TaxID=495146 RepID=UPI003081CB2A
MQYNNFSSVTEILLLGFPGFPSLKVFFFLLLLIIFCLTLFGNLLILVLVSYSSQLHSPMYFFLTQLSSSDILLTTSIVPEMLRAVLYEGSTISFIGCLAQFYVFTASETLESLFLTVMSYDRYQAICNPLRYASIMDWTFCFNVVLCSWLFVCAIILMISITMNQLNFCGPNIIDHFFCDFAPLLKLSCSNTLIIEIESIFLTIPVLIGPFTTIMISYVRIVFTILKIPSATGRQKTFSTCSSHLAVVSVYYGSLLSIYLFPNQKYINKVQSLLYTVVTPLFNPIIYSLRNKDIKKSFKKLLGNLSATFHS